jgi:hypothetical protein
MVEQITMTEAMSERNKLMKAHNVVIVGTA